MSGPMLGASSTRNDDDCSDILLDCGKKIFRKDRSSKANVYILSARSLSIGWADDQRYWRWAAHEDSRFSEVAELRKVCWFDISGKIDCKALSRKTIYAAYLIFKTKEASQTTFFIFRTKESSGLDVPLEAVLSIDGNESKRMACLKPDTNTRYPNVTFPQAREDGWMEIELGEFYNDDGEDGEVMMKLSEVKKLWWKSGLFVEGIEIRPKPRN